MTTHPTSSAAQDDNRSALRSLVILAWMAVGLAFLPLLQEEPLASPGGCLVASGALVPLGLLGIALPLTLLSRVRQQPGQPRPRYGGSLLWLLGATVAGWLLTMPVLVSNGRGRARTKAVQWNAQEGLEHLQKTWDEAEAAHLPPAAIPARLQHSLDELSRQASNPYRRRGEAYDTILHPFEGRVDEAGFSKALEPLATVPGCVVLGYQMPTASTPGFVGAVVKYPEGGTGPGFFAKVLRVVPEAHEGHP